MVLAGGFMKKWVILIAVVMLLIWLRDSVKAHPGRTDSSGGHTCRTNCSSWGYGYGEYHYHGGYDAYDDDEEDEEEDYYYVPQVQTGWVCKIGDEKYYSMHEAKLDWYGDIHNEVDRIYEQLLERKTNQADYDYWDKKFSFNDCQSGSWNSRTIWNEVLASEERKTLLANKTLADSAEAETPQAVSSQSESFDWWSLWWLLLFPISWIYDWFQKK